MKARELRLGNLIQDRNGIEEVNYLQNISGYNINDSYGSGGGHSGIPLTEEWLIKFDLKEGAYSDRRNPRYDIPGRGYEIHLREDAEHGVYFEGNCMTYIKFVHQLQNLVYALTGEELTIKEPAV